MRRENHIVSQFKKQLTYGLQKRSISFYPAHDGKSFLLALKDVFLGKITIETNGKNFLIKINTKGFADVKISDLTLFDRVKMDDEANLLLKENNYFYAEGSLWFTDKLKYKSPVTFKTKAIVDALEVLDKHRNISEIMLLKMSDYMAVTKN